MTPLADSLVSAINEYILNFSQIPGSKYLKKIDKKILICTHVYYGHIHLAYEVLLEERVHKSKILAHPSLSGTDQVPSNNI